MLSLLFWQYGLFWLGGAFAGFVVFIILGIIFDYRFFVLALIWLFLFLPLVVAFLYFFYGMLPLTTFNTIPHIIIFNQDEVRVRVIPNKNKEKEIEKNDKSLNYKEDRAEENSGFLQEIDPSKDFIVRREQFSEMKSGGDYVLLHFKKNGWLWLPVYAFDSFSEFQKTIESFGSLSTKENDKEGA